ncbi:MAG: hypothetical protein KJO07_17215 [Deltaproteobacteria bacterium]|nr:hypothetical protein [Deltaproteobacteria bacterium]
MNRAILGGVITAAIAVLTVVAYLQATSSLENRIESELEERVKKSVELLVQNANLDMLKLQKRAELTARERDIIEAMVGNGDAQDAFSTLSKRGKAEGEGVPDIFALVNLDGKLHAQMGIANPVQDQWLENGKPKYRSIALALDNIKRQVTSEVWDYQGRGLLKVGVAPVIDPDKGEVVGGLVMGYSLTATEAQRQKELLGAEVAYFYGGKVYASSFLKGNNEDTAKQDTISKRLESTKLADDAIEHILAEKVHEVDIGGSTYLLTAGRLPRFSSKALGEDYPGFKAGAVILGSLSEAKSAVAPVRTALGLLGLGAIILAAVGMMLVARTLLAPLDEIELGVNDIINGNLDRTFYPSGRDFEGLANALNVMMARLLGRPEPGEEEYDEDGNVIMPSELHFDTEGLSPKEAEAMALAQEPEPDYFNRLYSEYTAARKENGETIEGIHFDSFVAKLHLNESSLKRKYDCTAVRFKVIVKDGKVILKPVPIA